MENFPRTFSFNLSKVDENGTALLQSTHVRSIPHDGHCFRKAYYRGWHSHTIDPWLENDIWPQQLLPRHVTRKRIIAIINFSPSRPYRWSVTPLHLVTRAPFAPSRAGGKVIEGGGAHSDNCRIFNESEWKKE